MTSDSLKDITIVIPSYERPRYLERSLAYWNLFSIKVIVLDGSNSPLDKDFLSSLNSEVEYYHLPVSFEERLQIGMHLVTTSYVAMIGDDEYFLVQGLLACKHELEVDKALVSCTGVCWEFHAENETLVVGVRYVNWLEFCSISNDDPISRMHEYSRNAMNAICYSLVRTSAWRKATNIIVTNPSGVTFLTEIFIEMSIAFEGKTKIINVPFWLRSAEASAHWESESTVSVEKWLYDPKYKSERERYFDIFVKIFGDISTSNLVLELELFNAINCLSMRTSGVQNSSLSKFPFFVRIVSRLFHQIPAKVQSHKVFRRCVSFGKRLIKSHKTSDYRGLEKGEVVVLNMTSCTPVKKILGQSLDASFESFKTSVATFYGY
jgi:glycosyltransferase domain-containing protein